MEKTEQIKAKLQYMQLMIITGRDDSALEAFKNVMEMLDALGEHLDGRDKNAQEKE